MIPNEIYRWFVYVWNALVGLRKANIIIQIGLGMFESFPIHLLSCNLVHQALNFVLLGSFPSLEVTSYTFLINTGKVVTLEKIYAYLTFLCQHSHTHFESLLGFQLFWKQVLSLHGGMSLLHYLEYCYNFTLFLPIHTGSRLLHPKLVDCTFHILRQSFCK